MQVGNLVRFANPLTTAEQSERFVVLEMRGDRVLVEFVCTMTIRPTFVYLLSDLTTVN